MTNNENTQTKTTQAERAMQELRDGLWDVTPEAADMYNSMGRYA